MWSRADFFRFRVVIGNYIFGMSTSISRREVEMIFNLLCVIFGSTSHLFQVACQLQMEQDEEFFKLLSAFAFRVVPINHPDEMASKTAHNSSDWDEK